MPISKIKISPLLINHKNLYSVAKDKGLAKIGDSLVNLTFSLAKSIKLNKITGKKVPGRILSKALRESPLRLFAGKHNDAHSLADAVEAMIAFLWLKGKISITEIVNILSENMDENHQKNDSESNSINAFKKLLRKIHQLYK
ncbi:MAG: ribonuclease III family protein, partial [Candidatus Odinarchaeia archaeon]